MLALLNSSRSKDKMAKDLQSNTSEDTEEKIQQMDEGVPINDTNTNNVVIDSRRELLEAMGLGQEDEPNAPRTGFAVPKVQPMRLRGQGLGGERGRGK